MDSSHPVTASIDLQCGNVELNALAYLFPMLRFYIPLKHQKTLVLLTFSIVTSTLHQISKFQH